MEKYSEVLGLPVLCVETGKKVGVVEDIIFCPAEKKVLAFLLERKGCQVHKKAVLLDDVLNLGKDAVIVSELTSLRNIRALTDTEELKGKGEIKGLKVYTKSGEDIGIANDILFDYKKGTVEGILVSDGLLQDLVKGRKVLPLIGKVEFSEENILVEKEAVEEIIDQKKGLKNLLWNE